MQDFDHILCIYRNVYPIAENEEATLGSMHSDAKIAATVVKMKKPPSPELTNRRLSKTMPETESTSHLDNDPCRNSNCQQDLRVPGKYSKHYVSR